MRDVVAFPLFSLEEATTKATLIILKIISMYVFTPTMEVLCGGSVLSALLHNKLLAPNKTKTNGTDKLCRDFIV